MPDSQPIELFKHLNTAHQDSSKPSEHFKPTSRMGWMAKIHDLEPKENDDESLLKDERLQTLSIIKNDRERDMIALEMTIGRSCNDFVSQALIEAHLRLSPSIKGQGRKDLKEIVGGVKQNISIPTQLSKVRKIASSSIRGNGKEQSEEEEITEN